MDRLKVFDRALFEKQIGGIGLIVILDVICLITGVFFGRMSFEGLCSLLVFINMFSTCILYHNFIVSRGDMRFELNTEKMVYFPTTRAHFLMNKYAKILIFLLIQLLLTLACVGLGYFACRGVMDRSRFLGSLLIVFISILLTSGTATLVMHLMPMGIYLSMILYYPITLIGKLMIKLHEKQNFFGGSEFVMTFYTVAATIVLWILLLLIGIKIYEKVN